MKACLKDLCLRVVLHHFSTAQKEFQEEEVIQVSERFLQLGYAGRCNREQIRHAVYLLRSDRDRPVRPVYIPAAFALNCFFVTAIFIITNPAARQFAR